MIRTFVHLDMGRSSIWCGRVWKGYFRKLVPIVKKMRTTITHDSKGVKQGHFVVIATQGWKPERFSIKLDYLDHPEFLELLKQAEEEFGFSQVGALAIPCEPDDLKKIIRSKKALK